MVTHNEVEDKNMEDQQWEEYIEIHKDTYHFTYEYILWSIKNLIILHSAQKIYIVTK